MRMWWSLSKFYSFKWLGFRRPTAVKTLAGSSGDDQSGRWSVRIEIQCRETIKLFPDFGLFFNFLFKIFVSSKLVFFNFFSNFFFKFFSKKNSTFFFQNLFQNFFQNFFFFQKFVPSFLVSNVPREKHHTRVIPKVPKEKRHPLTQGSRTVVLFL